MNTNTTPRTVSPLLNMLNIICMLGEQGDWPADLLAECEKISIPTVKRHIAEARHMGADILSVRDAPTNSHVYQLRNWPQISAKVLRWHELEFLRDLRD